MKNNNFAYSSIITEFYDDKIKKNPLDKYYCFCVLCIVKDFILIKILELFMMKKLLMKKKKNIQKIFFLI